MKYRLSLMIFVALFANRLAHGQAPAEVILANRWGIPGEGGWSPIVMDAPIYLPDGRPAGFWPGMVAQVYLDFDGDLVPPLEPPTTFRVPADQFDTLRPAYIIPQTADFPQIAPLTTVMLRFRVWEGTKGTTYEEAQANGGFCGEAEAETRMGGGLDPPSMMEGLTGFTLTRARLLRYDGLSEQGLVFHLDSVSSVTYKLESSTDFKTWTPVQNDAAQSGAQITVPVGNATRFFRAVVQ